MLDKKLDKLLDIDPQKIHSNLGSLANRVWLKEELLKMFEEERNKDDQFLHGYSHAKGRCAEELELLIESMEYTVSIRREDIDNLIKG